MKQTNIDLIFVLLLLIGTVFAFNYTFSIMPTQAEIKQIISN